MPQADQVDLWNHRGGFLFCLYDSAAAGGGGGGGGGGDGDGYDDKKLAEYSVNMTLSFLFTSSKHIMHNICIHIG